MGSRRGASRVSSPGVSAGSRLDILTPEEQVYSVRKLFNLCDTDDVMFGHAANPKIVDVIADLLGCSEAAAATAASRGRRKLRRVLSEEENSATA